MDISRPPPLPSVRVRQVKVLRKGIVSHLAVLMTPWWCGMVDPVVSVSRAAEGTFQLAFPPHKRNEASPVGRFAVFAAPERAFTVSIALVFDWPMTMQAVFFVGYDLLHGLVDLLSQSRDQLCDLRVCTTEEAEEKVERVHATALTALSRLLKCVTGTASVAATNASTATVSSRGQVAALAGGASSATDAPVAGGAEVTPAADAELVAAVVGESIPALRKQCGSKYFGVRKSTYNFFGMLVNYKQYVLPHLHDFTVTMLSFFDEREPSNHEAMWASAIAFLRYDTGRVCCSCCVRCVSSVSVSCMCFMCVHG